MIENNRIIIPQPGPQTQFLKANEHLVLYGGGGGGGKVQPNHSTVQTPWGCKKIGDLVSGDILLNPDGSRQKILKVYPHKDWDFYRVNFSDGSFCEAGLEHLWVSWRASKDTKRSKRMRKEGNQESPYALFPNQAEIVTTKTMMDWLERGYTPLIPVTCPVRYEKNLRRPLKIDPYLLGVLIGDGCITDKGAAPLITRHPDDAYLIDSHLEKLGFSTSVWPSDNTRINFNKCQETDCLIEELKRCGLYGTYSHNKFIPNQFLYRSVEDREALLQGLMDTDGYVCTEGKLYYCTVSGKLSEDVKQLVESLGGVASIYEKQGSYIKEGKKIDCRLSYNLYIKLPRGVTPFRLRRKLERYTEPSGRLYRRVVSIEYSQRCDGACITVSNPNRLYLTDNFIVTHNTWGILADNLRFIHDPNYFSVFFRKTTIELETNLWPEALKMYRPFLEHQSGPLKGKYIGSSKIRDKDKTITFPSGAKSRFSYLELDKHADSWYGSEISRAYFDEFQMTSEYAFHVIRSRLRSKASFPSAMRCTMNPDQGHFVYNFVERFLDVEGYPVRELSGKTAWFLIVHGSIYTSWERKELEDKFPGKVPKSYTYIPSTLDDNKILTDMEPEYRDTLDSLPEVKRKQMLLGCWKVTDTQCTYFDRNWLHKTDSLPPDVKTVRAWDLASEEPNPNNRYPDFTASVKMSKCKNGFYYIHGCSRFRKRPGARDQEILATAKDDGRDCYVAGSVDPGAAGKFAFMEWVKNLTEEGVLVKKDPMPNNKSKIKKFEPFAVAAQNGLVYIIEDEFENREVLEDFYTELEAFIDARSTASRKDDQVDACATAFNTLAKERVIPVFSLGSFQENSPTAYKIMKEETS